MLTNKHHEQVQQQQTGDQLQGKGQQQQCVGEQLQGQGRQQQQQCAGEQLQQQEREQHGQQGCSMGLTIPREPPPVSEEGERRAGVVGMFEDVLSLSCHLGEGGQAVECEGREQTGMGVRSWVQLLPPGAPARWAEVAQMMYELLKQVRPG